MTHSQSETIAEAIVAAVAPLATKKDLEATRADIAALRKETRADAQFGKISSTQSRSHGYLAKR